MQERQYSSLGVYADATIQSSSAPSLYLTLPVFTRPALSPRPTWSIRRPSVNIPSAVTPSTSIDLPIQYFASIYPSFAIYSVCLPVSLHLPSRRVYQSLPATNSIIEFQSFTPSHFCSSHSLLTPHLHLSSFPTLGVSCVLPQTVFTIRWLSTLD